MKLLIASLFALSAGVAAASDAQPESNFNLTYALELDRAGQIVSLTPQPALDSPELQARVESEVRRWTFRPAHLDGQPVPTRTFLRLGVSAPGLDPSLARIV